MIQYPLPGQAYHLSPASAPNKVLGCAGGAVQSGTQVVLWDRDGTPNQQWCIEDVGGGMISFAPQHAPGQHLDTNNSGQSCHIWDQGGPEPNPNQQFRLEPLDPTHFLIRRGSDGACLDVHQGRTDNGATLVAWQDCHRGPNQVWMFSPANRQQQQQQPPPVQPYVPAHQQQQHFQPPPPGAFQPQGYQPQPAPYPPQPQQSCPPQPQPQAGGVIRCRLGHVADFNTDGFKCDECGHRGGRMNHGRMCSHRCGECSYDICAACQKARGLPKTKWICPTEEGPLTPVTNRDKLCDMCRKQHGMDALRCDNCDFTICGPCIEGCNMPPVGGVAGPQLVVITEPNPHGGTQHRLLCRQQHLLRPNYSNSARCDECAKNGQRYFQRCEECDYDICVTCTQAKGFPGPVLECKEGHSLEPRANSNYSCDMCHHRGGTGALRCSECDFDVCGACQKKMHYQMDAATALGMAGPRMSPDGFPVCTSNHPLKVSFSGFKCDVCTRRGGSMNSTHLCSLKCDQCDFDICNVCAVEKGLSLGRPRCAEGHPLVPRPNASYLCDHCRKAGNLKGMCCKDCGFDICIVCLEKCHFTHLPTDLPPLAPTNSVSGGTLMCRRGHAMKPSYNIAGHKCDECRTASKFRLRCSSCDYSCCVRCATTPPVGCLHSLPLEDKEGHLLHPRPNANYSCDICHHRGEMGAYRCDDCDFDICPKCMGQFKMVPPAVGGGQPQQQQQYQQAPQGSYPPQQGGYPPQQQQQPQQGGGYQQPPHQQQGGYPPQQHQQQQGYAPQPGGYPPQQNQGGGYNQPPQQQQQGNYPPQSAPSGQPGYPYPPQQQQQQQQPGYPQQQQPQGYGQPPQQQYPPQGSPYGSPQQQQQGAGGMYAPGGYPPAQQPRYS